MERGGFRLGRGVAMEGRLLADPRLSGPMPWVIAIMMFLTALAAAAGLAFAHAASSLGDELASRLTVQIVEGDPQKQRTQVDAAVSLARGSAAVVRAQPVSTDELMNALRPWLGDDLASGDLPVPALIDVDLKPGGDTVAQTADLTRAIAAVAPDAQVEAHAAYLAPVTGLIRTLSWVALAMVTLMAVATGAVVVLAARSALGVHRVTIDILHLMGATDVQIARLFQRRTALDALVGGFGGFAVALLVVWLIGRRLGAIGSDLATSVMLPGWGWVLLALAPIMGVALATWTARLTVLRALRRML